MRRSAAALLALLALLTGCQSAPQRMQDVQPPSSVTGEVPATQVVNTCRIQARGGVRAGYVMAGGTLELVFEFAAKPDQGTVQQALLAQLYPQNGPAPVGGVIRMHWESDTDLLLTIVQVQPGMTPWLRLALEKPAACSITPLLIGTPTAIWRWSYNLGGGLDRLPIRLDEPVRVLGAAADRPLVLLGLPLPPGELGGPLYRYSVLDVLTGVRQDIGAGNWQTTWAADGTLWLADPVGGLLRWQDGVLGVVQAGISSYLSPDGKMAAIFQAAHPEADPAGDRGADLTLLNLATGRSHPLRQVSHFVREAWLTPKADLHARVRAVWSTDSRALAVEDYATAESIGQHKPQGWAINVESDHRTQVGGFATFSPDSDLMFLSGRGLVNWQGEMPVPMAAKEVQWAPSGRYLWVPGAGVVDRQGELIWRLDEPAVAVQWLAGDRLWWGGHGLYTSRGERLSADQGELLAVAADGSALLTTDAGLVLVKGLGGIPQGDSSRPVWGRFAPGDSPLVYATADGRLMARRYDGKQFSPLAETALPEHMGRVDAALFVGGQLVLATGGPGVPYVAGGN